ncbi:MAG: hypothetical protein HY688_03420 [Chloroflexi bacterium]|nr:hypothetical protein [Chloroflexota bacterium]
MEPEFIHVADLLGGVELLLEAVRLTGQAEEPPAYARLRAYPEAEARRLRETAG